MPIGTTAPPDLGRLEALDERRLEAGVILWDRFCIVGEPRALDGTTVVTVTDLERKLGEPDEQHRLELHLLPAPAQPEAEARLRRAVGLKSRVQPRAHAIARAGKLLVLVCEPARGSALVGRQAASERQLLGLGVELASLLVELHAIGVYGVRCARAMLRIEHGHFGLDRFTHLLNGSEQGDGAGSPQADVDGLVELLRELGERDKPLALGPVTTAVELRERLAVGLGASKQLEFPTDPPFVGRARALAELDRGFDQAQIAQPTAILLQGQRGVGKSRLLSEFVAARLRADDSIVLTGAWQERSADSRGGLLSALEQLTHALAQLDPDERDDVRSRINRATRHLGAIVTRSAPSLGAVLRHVEELPPLELGEDFSRHTAVIADLLRAIGTQKRPLVLVLDNLESVDASSAAVIKILAQHRPAHHSVIIMGARTGTGFKADFEHESVDLAPLSVSEIEQLLTGVLPGEVADAEGLSEALWSISAGLPLVAWTNLRAWVDRGRLSRGIEDGVWRPRGELRGETDVRLDIYDVFGARLAAAAASVRELALRIAVLGVELSDAELRALEPDSEFDVDEAVADLVGRGLLARTEHGVRFPHNSIRELVFETADPDERRSAHQYAADVLVRQKAPLAQIVYHRDLALDPGASASAFDKLSRLHAEAGRERLAVYDLERARWHLERALEHSRDPEQRRTAAEGLADVCLLSDDVDTAVSLYTAIIATSEPGHAVAAAAKSVAFLWSKSSSKEARQLGSMALEAVSEPIPTTSLGKFVVFVGAVFRSWFIKPRLAVDIREALCRLYPWLTIISLVDDPVAVLMYSARAHWIAKGLESGAASIVRSIEGAMWSAPGFFDTANKTFAIAEAIAHKANDPWALGWAKHTCAHVSLLPSNRYEEGQDMLDDAIAAFRETGDVSISILSIMFKGLYGRDREHAEVVLGWYDEATATARRNGKFVATASLESLKLHVLARQGRTDLEPRMIALAAQLEGDDISGIERLVARVFLAFAAYESKAWTVAIEQVRASQALLGDLPGIPEYCSEIHLVTVLVMLERPTLTAGDRRLLRLATRKFRAAAKRSPRLRVLGELLELELALHVGNTAKARNVAVKIVEGFEVHENLYADREAHRALARLLKGDDVLAAAEHDRVARNLGRRLGLREPALRSDFVEIEDDGGMLGLTVDSALKADDAQHDIPAAGMLTSAVQAKRGRGSPSPGTIDEQTDVLEAWALTSSTPQYTILGDIIAPVREAVSGSIDATMLTVLCPDPSLEVPVSSGDLEVILINLLLVCRDAVSRNVPIEIRLEAETIDERRNAAKFWGGVDSNVEAPEFERGRYLTIRVSAPSLSARAPLLGAYATCERLVQSVGGRLTATTNRKQNNLVVRMPLAAVAQPAALRRTIVVHSDSAVREALGAVLDELGVDWRAFAPDEFDAAKIEHFTVLLVAGESVEELALFEPLFDLRIIEIVEHGAEPSNYGRDALRMPVSASVLKAKLR